MVCNPKPMPTDKAETKIAKCVIEGMKKAEIDLIQYLREDYQPYDPAHPDAVENFHWNDSPFTEIEKPDGN